MENGVIFSGVDRNLYNAGSYAMKMGGKQAFRGGAWDAATASGMAFNMAARKLPLIFVL